MQENRTDKWQNELNIDFSAECKNKENIKQDLLEQLQKYNEQEQTTQRKDYSMFNSTTPRKKRFKIIAVAVAVAILSISATALALNSYFNLGKNAQYIVADPGEMQQMEAALNEPLEDELKGKLFDANGKEAKTYADIVDGAYNANGEVIMIVTDGESIKIQSLAEAKREESDSSVLFSTPEEAGEYLAFDFQVPAVPEGFKIEGYRILKDVNGQAMKDSNYLWINYYKKDAPEKFIYVQIRYMNDNTSYVSGDYTYIEERSINGHDALVYDGGVDMLVGNVMYMIIGASSELSNEQLTVMAESIR